jgi:hypothetical protein
MGDQQSTGGIDVDTGWVIRIDDAATAAAVSADAREYGRTRWAVLRKTDAAVTAMTVTAATG